jgi:hypothetical protein
VEDKSMTVDVNGIFERLIEAHKVKTLKELSESLGRKPNWAASSKQRGTIPYDAIVQTSEEKGIPLDNLVYGSPDEPSKERQELKIKEEMLDFVFTLFNEDNDMPDLSASQSVKLVNTLTDRFKI